MRWALGVLVLGTAFSAQPAFAQAPSMAATDQVSEPSAVRSGNFRVSLGAGLVARPAYSGSRTMVGMVAPVVDVRWKDTVFLSTTGGLPSLGVNLLNDSGWRAGPVVRLRFPRKEKANAALRGMGNVDWAPEAGAFVEYRTGMFRLGAEARRGFGGHHGFVGELRADAVFQPAQGLVVSVGPRVNLGDATYMQRYYGVDGLQSLRTGYAQYKPAGGMTSIGAAGFASYAVTANVSLTGIVEYSRLQSRAAESPLVRNGRGDANQLFAGLSFSYSFGW